MKEYTVCALLNGPDGAEWTESYGDDFASDAAATKAAKAFGREVARENGARLIDAWAVDEFGMCSDS